MDHPHLRDGVSHSIREPENQIERAREQDLDQRHKVCRNRPTPQLPTINCLLAPLLIKQSKADARRAGRISSVADHVEEAECNVIIKAHGICGLRHDDQRRCKFDESKSMLRADDSMADSMRESLQAARGALEVLV